MDAHHGSAVMGHHRDAKWYHGTLKTFVPPLAYTAREHTGDGTFHHGAARAARIGQVDVMRHLLRCKPAWLRKARIA